MIRHPSPSPYRGPLRGIVLDWAGTVVDYGSRAPVRAFVELFAQAGVPVSEEAARRPMGRDKRSHLAAMLADPPVRSAWQQHHGREPNEGDLDRLYADFVPVQLRVLAEHAELIPGSLELAEQCRRRQIRLGTTTGYSRALVEGLAPLAAAQGLAPEVIVCADDVPAGRPAPWMIWRAAERMNAYPAAALVVVDDTPVGVTAGVDAGAWSVGVVCSGNLLGLSAAEVAALPADELQRRRAAGQQAMAEAGAHYSIDSVAELPAVLDDIQARLAGGQRP